ncbi:glycerol dehydrogenase [Martelella soudanensis]|uniref:glycerol dehydrogenase n=1 Tax=unclassified Martelella TaxID=2629616 RepID=UPI0015DE2FEE|nr:MULTISPECIES: glycerol dehydrogenase [unclassified Martelella]
MESNWAFFADVAVFGAPSRYVQGAGAVRHIGELARRLGDSAVLVTDPVILELYGEQISALLLEAGLHNVSLTFDGALGPDTASDLESQMPDLQWPVVLACGGGRAIDAGKALVERINAPLVTIPTAASNDAPTSKNFVLYDKDHKLLEVRHLTRNPDCVLIDTEILSRAPKHFFAAGLGDALSKAVEARACAAVGGRNMFAARPTRTALAIAEACEAVLLEHGAAAYDAAGGGKVTPSFEAAIEAMILMAGLGFESGGLSVAHAMTRGLSLVPGARTAQHGLQVAYGTTVQCELEGRKMPDALLAIYRHVGLPLSFHALAGRDLTDADIETITEATLPVPHMRNFPHEVSEAGFRDALSQIESRNGLLKTEL